MRICPICQSQVSDESAFCTTCGNRMPEMPQQAPAQANGYQNYYQPVPVCDPYDHTAEFDATDVHNNKVYALLMYMSGLLGIIIALLGCKDSAYVQFHLRQNLKFFVVEILLSLCASVLFFTFLVPIVAGIALAVVEVVKIIAFFQVCGNKSKEPAIIRGLGFLN